MVWRGEDHHRCVLLSHRSPTLKTAENHNGILSGLTDMLLFEALKGDGTAKRT